MDVISDGTGDRQAGIFASDEEVRPLIHDVTALIQQAGGTAPGPGRKRLLLAGICLSVEEPTDPPVGKRAPMRDRPRSGRGDQLRSTPPSDRRL